MEYDTYDVYNQKGKLYNLDRVAFQAWSRGESYLLVEHSQVTDLMLVTCSGVSSIVYATMTNGETMYIKREHLLEIPEELQDSARAMWELAHGI